jgi:integration host factor subunit beta
MNKSELILELAEATGMHKQVSEAVVKEVFNAMTEALVNNEGIEIRGFGSFSIREYESYVGRNPKSGEKIKVKPKKLPFFKVGKELKERVMKGAAASS